LLLAAFTCASAVEVTPIQKVLQMMQEMVVKAEAEKKEEAVKFSAFSQWCDDQTRIKTNEINKANEKIEMLKAEIAKAEAHIRALTDRINELEEDVGRWQQDQKSATDVRNKEAADFRATVQDYGESIDALSRAIAILKQQAYDRAQAAPTDAPGLIQRDDQLEESLVQIRSSHLVPQSAKSALTMFLQQTPDDQLFIKAPEANAYEFQSGGVVEMLEKLHDEFGTKKRELEEEELKSQHGFESIMQWLTDSIENANHEIDKKKAERAETEQAKAEAEGDLAQTTADRDADQQYLDDMTALCNQKKADFASRQKLRAEEIEALEKAIEIIGGQAVAGTGEKHLPQFLQIQQKSSLAMLRST
jgi:chromosome segregation ATPase